MRVYRAWLLHFNRALRNVLGFIELWFIEYEVNAIKSHYSVASYEKQVSSYEKQVWLNMCIYEIDDY